MTKNQCKNNINKAILQRIYQKFGKNITLTKVPEANHKEVYILKTVDEEFILMIFYHLANTQFYKYMLAQGIQKQLFDNGALVPDIIDAWIDGDYTITIHKKLDGKNCFKWDENSVYAIGKAIADFHNVSINKHYNRFHFIVERGGLWGKIRKYVYIIKKSLAYLTYLRFIKFPTGICFRDINERNLFLNKEGKIYLIDFDEHKYAPFVEEFVRFYNRRLNDKSLFPYFVKGYESVRKLTDKERSYISKTLNIDIE